MKKIRKITNVLFLSFALGIGGLVSKNTIKVNATSRVTVIDKVFITKVGSTSTVIPAEDVAPFVHAPTETASWARFGNALNGEYHMRTGKAGDTMTYVAIPELAALNASDVTKFYVTVYGVANTNNAGNEFTIDALDGDDNVIAGASKVVSLNATNDTSTFAKIVDASEPREAEIVSAETAVKGFKITHTTRNANTIFRRVVIEYVPKDAPPEPVFGALDHIVLDTSAVTKTFQVGETFESEGLSATAYDKSEPAMHEPAEPLVVDLADTVFDTDDIGTKVVTVSYTKDDVTKTATYEITVVARVLEDLLVSPGGSTNMNEEVVYSAKAFGGSPISPLSLKAVKNDGSVNIGLYANIRVYGNNRNGEANGNELTIAIGENYVITEVVFEYSSTSGSDEFTRLSVKADEKVLFAGADYLDEAKTFANLKAEEIIIKNISDGGIPDEKGVIANKQVHFDSILVKYALAVDVDDPVDPVDPVDPGASEPPVSEPPASLEPPASEPETPGTSSGTSEESAKGCRGSLEATLAVSVLLLGLVSVLAYKRKRLKA